NKYFNHDNKHNRIDTQPGKIEPMMVPIQRSENPEIWHTDLREHPKAAAYWYVNDTKTPGLYINSSVRMFSIAEGSSFDGKMKQKGKLE
ncbi:MAG: hypothetical protein MK132_22390, partial [Lentisphaerales bacterium]|nr:hypothetical protein [Lentisphaerales bacterium]